MKKRIILAIVISLLSHGLLLSTDFKRSDHQKTIVPEISVTMAYKKTEKQADIPKPVTESALKKQTLKKTESIKKTVQINEPVKKTEPIKKMVQRTAQSNETVKKTKPIKKTVQSNKPVKKTEPMVQSDETVKINRTVKSEPPKPKHPRPEVKPKTEPKAKGKKKTVKRSAPKKQVVKKKRTVKSKPAVQSKRERKIRTKRKRVKRSASKKQPVKKNRTVKSKPRKPEHLIKPAVRPTAEPISKEETVQSAEPVLERPPVKRIRSEHHNHEDVKPTVTPETEPMRMVQSEPFPKPGLLTLEDDPVSKTEASDTSQHNNRAENKNQKSEVAPVKTATRVRPVLKNNPLPRYPKIARRRGYEGTVLLDVLIDQSGKIVNAKVNTSSGFKMLDKAALKSVRGWTFEPGSVGGQKAEMWFKLPVRFELR